MADSEHFLSEMSRGFGLIIAFLLPGFIALWSLQYHLPVVAVWFGGVDVMTGADADPSPTAGSFLLVLLASLSLGMLLSALRWVALESWREASRAKEQIDYSSMYEKLAAVEYISENHYRYYLYYANSAMAIFVAAVFLLFGPLRQYYVWTVIVALTLIALLLAAAFESRNRNLAKLRDILGVKVSASEGDH